jgi:hypothetical protein
MVTMFLSLISYFMRQSLKHFNDWKVRKPLELQSIHMNGI